MGHVENAGRTIEALMPEVLDKSLSAFGDAEVFAFRNARRRAGIKPSTINRGLRTSGRP